MLRTTRVVGARTFSSMERARKSVLALIDSGKPYEARPAFCALFIVVAQGPLDRDDVCNRGTPDEAA